VSMLAVVRKSVRKVTSPTGLDWTVKRLVVPVGMRSLSPTEILDAATPRRTVVDGVPGRVPDAFGSATGPLPLGFLLLPVTLPFLPIVLLLRWRRLLPWTVEARTYPWGRRFPPIVLSYEIRGHAEALRAVQQLAEALARGDGAPVIQGAERIGEPRAVHDGSDPRETFGESARRLYGGR
jgi:hypothetical protein